MRQLPFACVSTTVFSLSNIAPFLAVRPQSPEALAAEKGVDMHDEEYMATHAAEFEQAAWACVRPPPFLAMLAILLPASVLFRVFSYRCF